MLIFSVLPVVLFACRTVDCICPLGSFGIHRFGPDCRFMCHCKNNEQCDDTTGECSSGCASFWYGPGCQYRDVAEGEFSRHSDNLDSQNKNYSNLANDGNSETCSYTAEVNSMEKKTNPFWRVWLPTKERISEIMILTKVEKLNYFKGFEVYVENVTANKRENNEFQPKDSQKCYRHTGDAPRNESIKVLCENSVVGNQVRIQLKTRRSQLVLCDVKINGGRNLAFDRDISQTQPKRETMPASNAVDGHDKQSDWTKCSYTTSVNNPLLKLDIGRNALIWFIRILPHKTSQTKGNQNLRLQLAYDKTSLIEKTVDIYPQTQSANITLNTAVARYVTITKTGESKRLQICELKVFGDCLDDGCGFDCSKTCHCKYTNIWDKMYGKCSSGCNHGWTGESCDQRSGTEFQQSCGHCLDPNGCDLSTGECRTGCQDGYYPPDCKKECHKGEYGQNCTLKCSDNCENDGNCNNVDGTCVDGCKPGYGDRKCEQECQRGRYGQNCRYTCPENCSYGVCDRFDGKCQSGCKPGYFGERCENKCHSGKYGKDCALKCSDNCKNGLCSNVDGRCVHGCKPGYSDLKCEQKCQSGRYGQNCRDTCPSRCNDGVCDHVDGKCQSGCKPGYFGEKCEYNCSHGKYGPNCTLKCSDNCLYGKCNNVDGRCEHGCKPGFVDEKCEQECLSGRYGHNCWYPCSSSCIAGLCDNVDGKCLSGCKPGYFGEKCESNCQYGKYGQNCTLKCSDNCKNGRCNNVDGRCVDDCKPGYSGSKCEQKCQSGNYGQNCQETCPSSCNDRLCDSVYGKCQSGCKPGYFGEKCENKCHNGKYGQNCTKRCSDNCFDGTCNNVDGKCVHGCKPGYLEGKCEQECPNGKYGQNCDKTCSKSCTNGLCDNVDGKCIYGCKPGYVGTKCEQNCDDGFYGTNCSMECGYCKNTTSCDKVSGICMEGCAIGYQGVNCLQAMEESRPTSAASIIGVSVAVCILLIVAVVVSVVIIVKRRKHSQRTEENRNSLENDEIHNTAERSDATSYQEADGPLGQTTGQLSIYANAVPTEANQISKSTISISALVEHVKGNSGQILEEFKALPFGMIHPSTVGMKPYNRGKNRYKDMRAYDHSRVILTKRRGEHGSDYINASFIKGYSKEQAYIAAQGPIENTIDDFWRMIWEQNVYTIVMLTNLVEEQKKKCLQYWPSEEPTIKYGNYIVCMVSEAIYAEFIVRNLTVSSEGKPPRNICQFHFKAWPDKGLPRSPSSLLQFWRKVRRMSKQRPWLVHCSAGVGRTGTFIATDILFDQVRTEGYVDVFAYVKDLRDQRTNMVQTKDQYKLLFVLMIECFILPSEPVSLDNIHRIMTDLNTVDSTSRKTKLKLQYKALNEDMSYLSTFDESEDRYSAARLADNKNKNRFSDIIPQNEFRPFLITNIPSCTNYVNAVFMPSYCEINSFILTQIPLENTAIDCCRLVYEQEVKVIVTFEDAVKGNVGMYLPERDSITLGPFIVVKTSEEDSEFYKKRTYTMLYKSEEKAITELAFKAWPKGLVVPKDPGAMLNFIQEVENHKRASGNKPVIVQCLNGAEKSGLIAVLVNILERARLEEEVSIPQVIRQLRVRREQIVPNFEQFQFCYDMLLHYVERDTTYANM